MLLVVLTAVLAAPRPAVAVAGGGEDAELTARARALQDELIAPCCWRQSLTVHDSPIADTLRSEIRTRLQAGESDDAIRADLVKRYGERIKAHPDGFPVGWFALGVFALAALAGGIPLALAVRSRRGRKAGGQVETTTARTEPEAVAPPSSAAAPAPSVGTPASSAAPGDERRRRLEQQLQAELDGMDA